MLPLSLELPLANDKTYHVVYNKLFTSQQKQISQNIAIHAHVCKDHTTGTLLAVCFFKLVLYFRITSK